MHQLACHLERRSPRRSSAKRQPRHGKNLDRGLTHRAMHAPMGNIARPCRGGSRYCTATASGRVARPIATPFAQRGPCHHYALFREARWLNHCESFNVDLHVATFGEMVSAELVLGDVLEACPLRVFGGNLGLKPSPPWLSSGPGSRPL